MSDVFVLVLTVFYLGGDLFLLDLFQNAYRVAACFRKKFGWTGLPPFNKK